MEDVRVIASEPHPMGSPEHEEVADHIVSQLEELGLSPEVQETTGLRYNEGEQVHAGRIKNIVARIPGTNNTGAVLLISHYDSMPTTNAAADGGVSTATLLETVCAIQAGPTLKNDVIVYVGDADVNGVIGPVAFHEHPWWQDISVGFAFEGIGPYGPSTLVYEGQATSDPGPGVSTSPQNPDLDAFPSPRNGWWLSEALEVLPHPLVILPLNDSLSLAGNFSPELATMLVGTDGAGLGFGQFRGSAAYHTILDNPERLDPRSLQDQGSNALSLTRHFGDLPLNEAEQQATPSLVAFNILPGRVLSYPSTWAPPLGVAVAVLFAALLLVGLLRRRLKVGGLFLGVLLFALSLIGTVVVTTLAWKFDVTINPAYQVWLGRGYYGADWHLLFLASLNLAFFSSLYLLARRFMRAAHNDESVAAGALVVLALLAVLTSMGIPSFSYLFVWPTLAGVLVLGFGILAPARAQGLGLRTLVLGITAFVPIVLFVPPIYSFYTLLAASIWETISPVVPLVTAVFVLLALMLGALVPHLQFLLGRRRSWVVPAAFAALALVFLIGELINTRFDAAQPRPDYVQYKLDANTGEASWISPAAEPDAWTKQFFSEDYTRGEEAFAPAYFFGQEFEVIEAPAPTVDLPTPRLEVLDDSTSGDTRTLRLTSPRGAPYGHLEMDLPAEWVEASVDGEQVEGSGIPAEQRRSFALMFYNLPDEGVEIALSSRWSTETIGATLTDYSNGLPEIAGTEIEPRPAEFMPAPYDFRDPTAVIKSFEL